MTNTDGPKTSTTQVTHECLTRAYDLDNKLSKVTMSFSEYRHEVAILIARFLQDAEDHSRVLREARDYTTFNVNPDAPAIWHANRDNQLFVAINDALHREISARKYGVQMERECADLRKLTEKAEAKCAELTGILARRDAEIAQQAELLQAAVEREAKYRDHGRQVDVVQLATRNTDLRDRLDRTLDLVTTLKGQLAQAQADATAFRVERDNLKAEKQFERDGNLRRSQIIEDQRNRLAVLGAECTATAVARDALANKVEELTKLSVQLQKELDEARSPRNLTLPEAVLAGELRRKKAALAKLRELLGEVLEVVGQA